VARGSLIPAGGWLVASLHESVIPVRGDDGAVVANVRIWRTPLDLACEVAQVRSVTPPAIQGRD